MASDGDDVAVRDHLAQRLTDVIAEFELERLFDDVEADAFVVLAGFAPYAEFADGGADEVLAGDFCHADILSYNERSVFLHSYYINLKQNRPDRAEAACGAGFLRMQICLPKTDVNRQVSLVEVFGIPFRFLFRESVIVGIWDEELFFPVKD